MLPQNKGQKSAKRWRPTPIPPRRPLVLPPCLLGCADFGGRVRREEQPGLIGLVVATKFCIYQTPPRPLPMNANGHHYHGVCGRCHSAENRSCLPRNSPLWRDSTESGGCLYRCGRPAVLFPQTGSIVGVSSGRPWPICRIAMW